MPDNIKLYEKSISLMDKAYLLADESHEREKLEYSASEIVLLLTDKKRISDKNPYDAIKYPMLNRQYEKELIDIDFNKNQKKLNKLVYDNKLTHSQCDNIKLIKSKLDSININLLTTRALKKTISSVNKSINKVLVENSEISSTVKKIIMIDLIKITNKRIKIKSNSEEISI